MTHTHKRTHMRAYTHAHIPQFQDKGSDTLAQVGHYVFKHNGSAIDTRAGKDTHARPHTAATLAQVRRYVFKHNRSAVDKLSQVRCFVYRL